MNRARLALAVSGLLTVVFSGAVFLSSCVDTTSVTNEICPPFVDFKAVSPLLEQRCGTLDCHGQQGRALRIYGNIGMRAPDPDKANDPQYYPGGQTATTDLELSLNYEAVCGLEPEIMTEVATGSADPSELTLMRKPRLTERHKGGRIWDIGKPGDKCLTGWLKATTYKPGEYIGADGMAAGATTCAGAAANPDG